MIVTNEDETKSETIKAQTDAENPYQIQETSKNVANGDEKKMQNGCRKSLKNEFLTKAVDKHKSATECSRTPESET